MTLPRPAAGYCRTLGRELILDIILKMKIEIRNAELEDAPRLAELSIQLGYPSSPQQSIHRLESILKSEEHAILVSYLTEGIIIGWIHVFLAKRLESDPFAEIGGFVVAEKYRGSGVGKILLTETEKWVIDHGISKIRVRSSTIRENSHAIFTHLGFTKTKDQYVFDKQIK